MISKNVHGLYWPDYDGKAEKAYEYIMKRVRDVKLCLPYVKHKRLAIQAGAHAGIWPLEISKYFDRVICFEPEPILFECLTNNVVNYEKITPLAYALGNFNMSANLAEADKCGRAHIGGEGTEVEMARLDDLGFKDYDEVSVIFLDVERYEIEALKGAVKTVERNRPVLHLEVHRDMEDAIHSYMSDIKYKKVLRMHDDEIFVPC